LNHGGVERRLEHLVLEVHVPVRRQRRVDLARALQVAVEGAAEVLLSGEVGTIADPHRDGLAAELAADVDHLEVVRHGLRAHGRVGMREAAELVAQRLAFWSEKVLELTASNARPWSAACSRSAR
jgi:hypothetical protein